MFFLKRFAQRENLEEQRKNLEELIDDICEAIKKNNIKVSYIFVNLSYPENTELGIYVRNRPGEDKLVHSYVAYSYEMHGFTPPSNPKDFARKLALKMGLHFEAAYEENLVGEWRLTGYSLKSDECVQFLEEIKMKKENLRRC